MLGWVTSEEVDMVQAAMAAIAALLITGAIEARKAVSYVDWGLLLLIGSAIGLSQAMSNSGLARYVGESLVLSTALNCSALLLDQCSSCSTRTTVDEERDHSRQLPQQQQHTNHAFCSLSHNSTHCCRVH
jgi:Sodium:sulfate symporter transmembrane region